MAKNRFQFLQKQPSPPPSPPNTFHIDDDDDDDICPVCDGECTCANKSQPLSTNPLSMSQLSALHVSYPPKHVPSSAPPIPTAPPSPQKQLLPSLKIKLSLGKRRAQSPRPESPSHPKDLFSAPSVPIPSTSHQPHPKRRGRPPKAVVSVRPTDNHATTTLSSHPSKSTKQKKLTARPQAPVKPRPVAKKSSTKRRRVVSSDESSSSDLTDVDHLYTFPDDDDSQSVQFPTFVSASAMSSRASSSDADSSELSSFDDSDSSIEAEEEKFIVSEMQGRARVRRELLGDDALKKRDPHNAWVIRPRKKSVGAPSDVEMDIDTDATEDEQEEEEDAGELDEEEADERSTGTGYVGVATGWSEDEDESSFDADLFFANLTDSEDHDASLASDGEGDDGDHSDMESMEASITSLPAMPPEFEVLERWDGQIVFTNGLLEGQGMLDMDFEAHAASLAETSSSPSQMSDVEMSDVDDRGYEEDADEGDGETTDEELVGEDDLPNERAMRLFITPFSVSAINPMSTMSPAVSPGPRDRRPYSRSVDSPKPADILSGKFFWDSDDHDEYEESTTKSLSQVSSNGQGPRAGHFVPAKETRQVIIDDLHKDIPSPHPRFRRRRPSFSHFRSVEHLLQQHLASQQLPTLPCSPSPFHLVTPTVDKTITMSPEMASAELVDLNDVLEASFLDPEPPSDSQNTSTDTEAKKQQLKSFNRWDVISVGAFRQSREGEGGWGSDSTPAKTDYGSMMKSSPLSTMLWQNKANNPASNRRSGKMSVVISPVILPVRDRDGDRTPTNLPPPQRDNRHDNYNYPHKSRKELRRERKMKRKSYGAIHHPNQRHQHHNHHQHHPNMKSRTTSSSQRTNFFSNVPPLNL